jgi:hypothetical protein
MRKLLAVLVACGAVAVASPEFYAGCGGTSTPFIHQSGSFQCDDSKGEVTAFAYQLDSGAATNTGTENIACEAADGLVCFGGGTAGDGVVDIETDWGNTGAIGCPIVGTTFNRIVLALQCNDGKGLLVSVGRGTVEVYGVYTPDSAHPSDGSPLVADNRVGKPTVNSATNNADGTSTLNLSFPTALKVYNECDPGSAGQAFGACADNFVPSATVGRVFTSIQRCGTKPSSDRGSTLFPWTLNAATPDATGRAIVTAARPTTTGDCLFVGVSANINGFESQGITGFTSVGGPGAASPVAVGVRAEQATANVQIRWRTDVEIGLAGFNVLAEGKKGIQKVSDAMIPAKGNGGGTTYETSIPRGKFQGSRTVIIESVLSDGTTLKSAPAKF